MVFQRYVEKVPGSRPHIPVPVGAPLANFAAVARDLPVFALSPAPTQRQARLGPG
ncbi:hypothetical protein GCM10012283_28200 [Phycicoccus endophyticus]|nr:hypothetical protein GCM10012283_28200 [Phycicoccus endophyticus]